MKYANVNLFVKCSSLNHLTNSKNPFTNNISENSKKERRTSTANIDIQVKYNSIEHTIHRRTRVNILVPYIFS